MLFTSMYWVWDMGLRIVYGIPCDFDMFDFIDCA